MFQSIPERVECLRGRQIRRAIRGDGWSPSTALEAVNDTSLFNNYEWLFIICDEPPTVTCFNLFQKELNAWGRQRRGVVRLDGWSPSTALEAVNGKMFNIKYEWLFIICDELSTMTYTYFNIIPERVECLRGRQTRRILQVTDDHHQQL
jgi:adenylate kinase family enzyme